MKLLRPVIYLGVCAAGLLIVLAVVAYLFLVACDGKGE